MRTLKNKEEVTESVISQKATDFLTY